MQQSLEKLIDIWQNLIDSRLWSMSGRVPLLGLLRISPMWQLWPLQQCTAKQITSLDCDFKLCLSKCRGNGRQIPKMTRLRYILAVIRALRGHVPDPVETCSGGFLIALVQPKKSIFYVFIAEKTGGGQTCSRRSRLLLPVWRGAGWCRPRLHHTNKRANPSDHGSTCSQLSTPK